MGLTRWAMERTALQHIAATAAAVAAATGQAQDCPFARDGTCDEPDVCPRGTDAQDCAGAASSRLADSGSGLDSLAQALASGVSWIGLLAFAAAAFVLYRRLGAPRSGQIAIGLALIGIAYSGLGWLPYALLEPLLMLTGAVGVGLFALFMAAGLAVLGQAIWRNAGTTAVSGPEAMARAALSPDMHEGEIDEISAARRWCQETAMQFESRLAATEGRYHVYAQYDAASQPWLQIDRLASDSRGAFIASLRVEFKPQPFGMFPVLVNLAVDDRGRRRRVGSIVEFGEAQIDSLVQCLQGHGPRWIWKGQQLREWPWQLWRSRQRAAVLESPFMAGVRANVKLLLLGLAALLVYTIWSQAPVVMTLVLLAAVVAYFHWYVPPPRYRVTSTCPPRPPRSLLPLDSWQALVRDLGAQRDEVVDRLETILKERMAGTDEPVNIRREVIWYEGATGKVERQQLTVSLRRAIVFVRIYRYSDDLFVGWDAHVNQMAWKDKPVQTGHRSSDGIKVQLVSVETQFYAVNEYDITDANFLLEATHVHLTALLKQVLREREIDQELDFTIVRESRQSLIGNKPQEGRRRLFSRA